MTLLKKEERADELLNKEIPTLEEEGNGKQLETAYRELLSLSRELVEEHNRYSWTGVPEECKARLFELDEIKVESTVREPEAATETPEDSDPTPNTTEVVEGEAASEEADGGYEERAASDSELYEVLEPEITYDDVVGLEEVKDEFKDKVEAPFRDAKLLNTLGIDPPNGTLLFGPPGCGKTRICKATANELDATVVKVKGSDVVSKYVGEPQKNVAKLFEEAKNLQPCIVIFDEIDVLLAARGQDDNPTGHDKMVGEFLANMSELDPTDNVFLVGTTNKQDTLDNAATRPGRLDGKIYVPLPDEKYRREMIELSLSESRHEIQQTVIKQVAAETSWYSFADLEKVVNEAGWTAYRNGREMITDEDLIRAVVDTTPSVDREKWEPKERDYREG